ncbi:hypothetical protein AMTR_s00072p00038970 [Amborella trichopoda]|uniref:Uncharacterized protein n=1 Tax=Amborella trichopoda TaxID=13333 RepID=W1NRA7_AMBTC|nr:hypothetical protein AMTR_s00072p00038970 [Amborella trichopoda]
MEVQGKAVEMLSAMMIGYTGLIVVVEEAIGINELNWNPMPRRRRALQNEAQRLAAEFPFDSLIDGPSGITKGGTPFYSS